MGGGDLRKEHDAGADGGLANPDAALPTGPFTRVLGRQEWFRDEELVLDEDALACLFGQCGKDRAEFTSRLGLHPQRPR